MVKLLSTAASAKINLFLRITGRRTDGYHQLDSVFVPVSLCDRVSIAMRSAGEARVWLRCDMPELGPEDQNLAVRAARAFMAEFGVSAEVMIDLRKSIPAGAGLGGGSSDAGAVLRVMARLCGIGDGARLRAVAYRLGADVPFFLDPVPARVRGIGEHLEPLGGCPQLELVIAVPPITVSTADIFRNLDPREWSGPASALEIEAARSGRIACALMVNDLAAGAMRKFPVIAELKSRLEATGASAAAMSGSGGAVFGVFASRIGAESAAAELQQQCPTARVFTAHTIEGPQS
jgi:4-diphosphocytidyl-2-C-methyl-D-erythritol kinase